MKSEAGTPEISIVIPTLNEEKYLEGCLRSILSQKFARPYELIIADGGSEDRTIEIARKYTDKIVTEPIRTIAAGRQAGSKIASGEIIAYTGADVILPNSWLAEITRPFSEKSVAAVTGKPMPQAGTGLEYAFCDHLIDPLAQLLNRLSLFYVYGDNFAIRKSVFDKIGGFNITFATAEDTDIIKRARAHGRIVYNPCALAYASNRRWVKWGSLNYLLFHITNFFKTHLFNKPHSHYEAVR